MDKAALSQPEGKQGGKTLCIAAAILPAVAGYLSWVGGKRRNTTLYDTTHSYLQEAPCYQRLTAQYKREKLFICTIAGGGEGKYNEQEDPNRAQLKGECETRSHQVRDFDLSDGFSF